MLLVTPDLYPDPVSVCCGLKRDDGVVVLCGVRRLSLAGGASVSLPGVILESAVIAPPCLSSGGEMIPVLLIFHPQFAFKVTHSLQSTVEEMLCAVPCRLGLFRRESQPSSRASSGRCAQWAEP